MERRFVEADRMDLPDSQAIATQPLERACPGGVGRAPARAQGEIDLTVTVDVMGLDADVILVGDAADDVVPFPGRVLVPDDGILAHGDDVQFSITINVRHRDRVADIPHVRVDLLGDESRRIGLNLRKRQQECQDRGMTKSSHRILRLKPHYWFKNGK